MALAITKKDHTVLLYSRITKEYEWLYEMLISHDKITVDLINSLDDDKRNFMENIFSYVLRQAILEWKEKLQIPKDLGEDNDKWIQCSLCGTPNRYIHYIINKKSKRKINVGSDCVKEYAFNDKNIHNQREEARKLRRQNLLNTELPGIKRKVDNWHQEMERFNVWIPLSISRIYVQTGDELKKTFYGFLDGKGTEVETLGKIQILLAEGEREIDKFKKHVDKNRNNDFVVTKDVYKWINRNKNNQSIQTAFKQLKYDGIITYQTAHRISERRFMEKVLTLLNKHLKKRGIIIQSINESERVYRFEIESLKGCKLFILHEELLVNFGWVLFEEEPFNDLNEIEFIKCAIIKEEHSTDIMLREISSKLTNLTINLSGYDYEFNEIVLFDKKKKEYRVLPLIDFVSKFKVLSLKYDSSLIRQLLDEKGEIIELNDHQKNREGYTPL